MTARTALVLGAIIWIAMIVTLILLGEVEPNPHYGR